LLCLWPRVYIIDYYPKWKWIRLRMASQNKEKGKELCILCTMWVHINNKYSGDRAPLSFYMFQGDN
jgi:hypothetical protein